MIQALGHVALYVHDLQASEHFYCGILGLAKVFEAKNEAGKVNMVYLNIAPGQYLELFLMPDPTQQWHENPVGPTHLCLTVADIEAAEALLTAKQWPHDPVRQGKYGNSQCWTADPDGTRIELMQIFADFLQAT